MFAVQLQLMQCLRLTQKTDYLKERRKKHGTVNVRTVKRPQLTHSVRTLNHEYKQTIAMPGFNARIHFSAQIRVGKSSGMSIAC